MEALHRIHFLSGQHILVSRAKSQAQPERVNNQNKDIKKLFIGGIPVLTTLKEFRSYFSQFGDLVDVMLPLKSDHSLLNSGFGFVTFKESISAINVLNSNKQHSFRGKFVTS